MKSKYNKLTCLFGFHDFDKNLTEDKHGNSIHLCKICKKSGDYKWKGRREALFDYDEEGNLIHSKWNNGDERWWARDEKGNLIHEKWNDQESWFVNGNWVNKKPKNWKYEKQIQ